MIYNLCNQGYEQIATFAKLTFIKKSSLTSFNHLTDEDTVQEIITNLPDSAHALILNLLPENFQPNYTTRATESGNLYSFNGNLALTPQDKNLQHLLEDYNNQEGIVLVEKEDATHIYGTTQNPILFIYSELHSSQGSGLKGYTINLSGDCLGSSMILEDVTLNIFTRGLAFQLAGSL